MSGACNKGVINEHDGGLVRYWNLKIYLEKHVNSIEIYYSLLYKTSNGKSPFRSTMVSDITEQKFSLSLLNLRNIN